MTRRPRVRALPALAVLALLSLAAAGPRPAVGPAPPSMIFSTCSVPLDAGGGDSSHFIAQGQGITQPLPAGIIAASCSLGTATLNAFGFPNNLLATLCEWDPLTLAPAANTIALRILTFDLSRPAFDGQGVPRMLFFPPFVGRSLDHVAEPLRSTTAVEYLSQSSWADARFETKFDPAAGSTMPAGFTFGPGEVRSPLPGAHAVFEHDLCGGSDDLQQLRVAQSVVRQDELLSTSPMELMQRFRVPEPVELRWVELAIGVAQVFGYTPANIAIVDGAGLSAPPFLPPPPLVAADFYHYSNLYPQWAIPFNFDHTVVLEPYHDYWLWVRTAQFHAFYARHLTGSDPAEFTSNIGVLYTRNDPGNPWAQHGITALDFRIIGRPLSSLGVAPTQPGNEFVLHISPNPSGTLPEVNWSGAVGPVKLEVFDAHGRRVATGEGGAAGRWRLASGGSALSAGVYFVHARDTAGGHAVERVVIVR